MHVVHVLHTLAVGGTENGVVNLVGALAGAARHTVVAVTTSGALAARLPEGVAVHALGKRPGIDVAAQVRLVALLRRLRPDIVHTRNWGAFDAVPAARLAGVRLVVHGEHGREAADPEGRNRRRNRLRRLLAPLVSHWVTVSHDLRRWLVHHVGIPGERVTTIHNGVDTHRFAEGDREGAREALGLPAGAPVVGTVGRLDPVKDHARLVAAFRAVVAERPDALLLIVGDGPLRDDLQQAVAAAGLERSVRLLGERDDIPRVLAALDVFTLPSLAEGISNTILEAMATGLPVVATNVGGNPELVEDGVTGRLVEPRRTEALAAALLGYVNDPVLARLHGKAGRQRCVTEFSLDRMAARYLALYRRLARETA
ncbi:MAG TPA: TIGR03088 family PEP-CTERM/XrtA system glycosyltransferase, partial [Candidatus Binatia bacterium]|nr:TIGR03088 family PEP-CTERM/XrtA system glycosyltransferase [Candidatus Binatia bacterium]